MENKCFGEEYHTKFDPKKYLDMFYSERNFPKDENGRLQQLHKLFANIDVPQDGRLLDFGCGPAIWMALIASRAFQHITLAEYTEANRQELFKWLHKEQDAFDWSHVLTFVGKLQGVSSEQIATKSRSAIQEVIPCDITKEDILLGHDGNQYDLVMSCLCMESACRDMATYAQGMKKLCCLIKSGGYLYLNGNFGETWYTFSDEVFQSFPVTKEGILQAVKDAGMEIKHFDYIDQIEQPDSCASFDGHYYLLAFKPGTQ